VGSSMTWERSWGGLLSFHVFRQDDLTAVNGTRPAWDIQGMVFGIDYQTSRLYNIFAPSHVQD